MNDSQKRDLIERFIEAYNDLDVDRMMAWVDPAIEFQNVSNGEVNARTSGADEFRALAEQSKQLFTSRKQTVTKFEIDGDRVSVEIEFRGVPASDLPNGMMAGTEILLSGRSEYTLRDGKIVKLTDLS